MPFPGFLPLRWESSDGQWWYASPMDCAVAHGFGDLAGELLRRNPSLVTELTSLQRTRRLETVWDDLDPSGDIAKHRLHAAKKLLDQNGKNRGGGIDRFIRSGYGGWLLYTGASAGDLDFVKEVLLGRNDNRLLFGAGEYGVTDIFYAAARSRNPDLSDFLLDSCISSGNFSGNSVDFRSEMINRAIHAAAKAGHLEFLKKLLMGLSETDVLDYRDSQGCTVLHTSSGNNQLEVVGYLLEFFGMTGCTDRHGNTALHVASLRGCVRVVKLLVQHSPSMATAVNDLGDTVLHMAVSGFTVPGFRPLDRHMEMMRQLIHGDVIDVSEIIDRRNRDGRTALQIAIADKVRSDVIELLLGHVAGGISVSDSGHSGTKISINSPGTSFRIPDSDYISRSRELLTQNSSSRCSSDLNRLSFSAAELLLRKYRRSNSITRAARKLRNLLLPWPTKKNESRIDVEGHKAIHL